MLIFVALAIISGVHAARTPILIDYEVAVKFDDERDFSIEFPSGYESHFEWEENDTHSDRNIDLKMWYELDENEYCSNSVQKIGQLENITGSMSGLLHVCKDMVKKLNSSKENELINRAAEWESLYKIENERREDCANESISLEEDLTEKEAEYKQCIATRDRLDRDATNCEKCVTDLEKCTKDNSGNTFLFLGIGLAIGWFLWGRKKSAGPSEQSETGYDYEGMPNDNR